MYIMLDEGWVCFIGVFQAVRLLFYLGCIHIASS